MKPVGITRNADGTWTAWIFSTTCTGTYDECRRWLEAHGESV